MSMYQGDCLDVMPTLDANSIDSIVTDPPYGLSFMGKDWDHGVPGEHFWKEALRVAKPGAFLLAFGGSRTFHRLASAIEDAGWELRDTIMWVYGSGFPKSHNGDWGGTALKPAHEPIVMARKPFKGTVEKNYGIHGTGGLNIDDCRVSTEDSLGGGNTSATVDRSGKNEGWRRPWMNDVDAARAAAERSAASVAKSEDLGRWPANLIHDGSHEVLALFPESKGQQGDVKGTEPSRTGDENTNCYGEFGRVPAAKRIESDKSAARFFYCAKASKTDRNNGCDSIEPAQYSHDGCEVPIDNAYQRNSSVSGNNHPTVKPTDLMRYLCRLVTPPGGTILDPFMGSGSTGKAAVLEGFEFVGIERESNYLEIARARVAAVTSVPDWLQAKAAA